MLKISTKGRYGTRALLEMATRYGDGPVQLKDIARTQQISLQYLQQILGPLNAAGLIHTTRGVKGGVWLAKPPREITLSQIVEAQPICVRGVSLNAHFIRRQPGLGVIR